MEEVFQENNQQILEIHGLLWTSVGLFFSEQRQESDAKEKERLNQTYQTCLLLLNSANKIFEDAEMITIKPLKVTISVDLEEDDHVYYCLIEVNRKNKTITFQIDGAVIVEIPIRKLGLSSNNLH